MKHELRRSTSPLHLNYETYLMDAHDLLEHLKQLLEANGYRPEELVYSGFDGSLLERGEPLPSYPYIYVMNEAGWREAISTEKQTPADYALDHPSPYMGLYDRSQLRQVYSSGMHLGEDYDERIVLTDIVLGDPLSELDPNKSVSEAVVHVNYPDAMATDALIGVVRLEES